MVKKWYDSTVVKCPNCKETIFVALPMDIYEKIDKVQKEIKLTEDTLKDKKDFLKILRKAESING